MAETKISLAQNDLNNAQGSFSELLFATDQGKNAIATSLTNKGVPTTASETLIQMADKVNNLNIDNQVSNIIGDIYTDTKTESASNLGLSPFAACPCIDNWVAVTAAGKLYVYEYTSNYSSLGDALSNAPMQIDLITPSSISLAYITASRDGRTIISYAFDTNKTVDIYDVNYDTKSLSYVKSITGIGVYRNHCRMAITNDRSLIAAYTDWSNSSFIYSVDNPEIKSSSLNINMDSSGSQFAFDEDNSMLYAFSRYDGNTINKVSYNYIKDTSITFTKHSTKIQSPSGIFCAYIQKQYLLLFSITSFSFEPYIYSIGNAEFGILDLKTAQTNIVPVVISTIVPGNMYNTSTLKNPMGIANLDIKRSGNTYDITLQIPNTTIKYDRNSNSIINVDNKMCYSDRYLYPNEQDSYFANMPVLRILDNKYITTFVPTPEGEADSGQYICSGIKHANKFLGVKHAINGVEIAYTKLGYTKEQLDAGYYDLNTTITPAVPDTPSDEPNNPGGGSN